MLNEHIRREAVRHENAVDSARVFDTDVYAKSCDVVPFLYSRRRFVLIFVWIIIVSSRLICDTHYAGADSSPLLQRFRQ